MKTLIEVLTYIIGSIIVVLETSHKKPTCVFLFNKMFLLMCENFVINFAIIYVIHVALFSDKVLEPHQEAFCAFVLPYRLANLV